MVAGFHIAKSILHRCVKEEDLISFIDSNKGKFLETNVIHWQKI